MDITKRIEAFAKLGQWLKTIDENSLIENPDFQTLHKSINLAVAKNAWFTKKHILAALHEWGMQLTQANLTQWTQDYATQFEVQNNKRVGIVMAGNIPLVGFHDFLTVLIAGFNADVKLSSSDDVLLPVLTEKLFEIAPEFQGKIHFVTRLKEVDAVIATGSNNTSRYFEEYFGHLPNIIRKSRNSVAVLNGNESVEDLKLLADDLFQYFGLGCRNVTKIYLPEGAILDPIFEAVFDYNTCMEHNKYMNNFDYYRAIYLLNREPFLENGFLIMKEEKRLSTPVAVVHYEFYKDINSVKETLAELESEIQCVVSNDGHFIDAVPFGRSQQPKLSDYADNVNTLAFLKELA